MVLVGYLTGMKILNPSKLDMADNSGDNYRESVLKTFISFTVIVILFMLTIFPAVVIAYSCNENMALRILHIICAFFLSDIYMCNYVIRKFILKDKKYC